MFLDLEKKEFRLRPESPAIKMGAGPGYTLDFDNQPVPEKTPDADAFQRHAPITQ